MQIIEIGAGNFYNQREISNAALSFRGFVPGPIQQWNLSTADDHAKCTTRRRSTSPNWYFMELFWLAGQFTKILTNINYLLIFS